MKQFGTLYKVLITFLFFAAFGTAKGQLTVIKPAGGEVFYNTRDTITTIEWAGVEESVKVRVEYSSDGGIRWKVISDTAVGLKLEWRLSGLSVGSNYKVRVSVVRPPSPADNIQYVGHVGPVYDAYWSPKDKQVVSVSADAHIWEAAVGGPTPLVILPGARSTYNSTVWSNDSLKIAVGNSDGDAIVFETETNQIVNTISHNASVARVEFDPTGEYLLTQCDDDRGRMYRLPNAQLTGTYNPAATLLNSAMSPDGTRTLLCANDARVYSRAGGLPLTFSRHLNGVLAGAWSKDGTSICTIGGDITIRLWDAVTGVEKWVAQDPAQREGVRSVAFSPNGQLVAVGMSDSTVTVWDATSGALVRKLGGHRGPVVMVEFSPNSEMLASASLDDFVNVYSVETWNRIRGLQHSSDAYKCRWSSTNESILTCSKDGTARVWRILDVALEADTSGAFSIAPPPPSFARFITTGGTVDIGSDIVSRLYMEGASQLELAQIDSVQFTLKYDASMLHLKSSDVPIRSRYDSARHEVIILEPMKLPYVDGDLNTVRFTATLGADSISSFEIVRIVQIGLGTGMRTEVRTSPITVKGICRANGEARLYFPIGTQTRVDVGVVGEDCEVRAEMSESSPTTIRFYNNVGQLLYTYHATPDEVVNRTILTNAPIHMIGRVGFVVVETRSTSVSKPYLLAKP